LETAVVLIILACVNNRREGNVVSKSKEEIMKGIARLAAGSDPGSGVNPQRVDDLVAWMVITMMADGKIDAGERDMILDYARQHGISTERIRKLVKATGAGPLAAPVPSSKDEARDWIREMARMSMADGEMSKVELAAVNNVAVAVGLERGDLKQIIDDVRANTGADLDDLSREVRRRSGRGD
jgi:tellurite resistance protein